METAALIRTWAKGTLQHASKGHGGRTEMALEQAWLAVAGEMERPCTQLTRHGGHSPQIVGLTERAPARRILK
ncbi:MAG: hypothetical protein JO108_13535 [Acidobacteriaceae bacterium]|nr:hypothetical protein [Acidobacteriaceae bacterium]